MAETLKKLQRLAAPLTHGDETLTTEEAFTRLRAQGSKITHLALSSLLQNPADYERYCILALEQDVSSFKLMKKSLKKVPEDVAARICVCAVQRKPKYLSRVSRVFLKKVPEEPFVKFPDIIFAAIDNDPRALRFAPEHARTGPTHFVRRAIGLDPLTLEYVIDPDIETCLSATRANLDAAPFIPEDLFTQVETIIRAEYSARKAGEVVGAQSSEIVSTFRTSPRDKVANGENITDMREVPQRNSAAFDSNSHICEIPHRLEDQERGEYREDDGSEHLGDHRDEERRESVSEYRRDERRGEEIEYIPNIIKPSQDRLSRVRELTQRELDDIKTKRQASVSLLVNEFSKTRTLSEPPVSKRPDEVSKFEKDHASRVVNRQCKTENLAPVSRDSSPFPPKTLTNNAPVTASAALGQNKIPSSTIPPPPPPPKPPSVPVQTDHVGNVRAPSSGEKFGSFLSSMQKRMSSAKMREDAETQKEIHAESAGEISHDSVKYSDDDIRTRDTRRPDNDNRYKRNDDRAESVDPSAMGTTVRENFANPPQIKSKDENANAGKISEPNNSTNALTNANTLSRSKPSAALLSKPSAALLSNTAQGHHRERYASSTTLNKEYVHSAHAPGRDELFNQQAVQSPGNFENPAHAHNQAYYAPASMRIEKSNSSDDKFSKKNSIKSHYPSSTAHTGTSKEHNRASSAFLEDRSTSFAAADRPINAPLAPTFENFSIPRPISAKPYAPAVQPFSSSEEYFTSPPRPYFSSAQPYAPAAQPYAPPAQPYAPAAQPYAPAAQPYFSAAQPYAPAAQSYFSAAQPYASAAQPYASAAQPYASAAQPYAPSAQPYASAAQPYAPAVQPYAPAAQPYAPAAQPYAPAARPYASAAQPYKAQEQFSHFSALPQHSNSRAENSVQVRSNQKPSAAMINDMQPVQNKIRTNDPPGRASAQITSDRLAGMRANSIRVEDYNREEINSWMRSKIERIEMILDKPYN